MVGGDNPFAARSYQRVNYGFGEHYIVGIIHYHFTYSAFRVSTEFEDNHA